MLFGEAAWTANPVQTTGIFELEGRYCGNRVGAGFPLQYRDFPFDEFSGAIYRIQATEKIIGLNREEEGVLIVNQEVEGSNPSLPTNCFRGLGDSA
jgi:hypothetical protein